MTTVLACARDGRVVMAADSMCNIYDRPVYSGADKIIRIRTGDEHEVLLGCSGASGIPAALRAHLTIVAVPKENEDADAWAYGVAEQVTRIASDVKLVDDGNLDGCAILGWGGRVWTIAHGVAVFHTDGVAAIGSGEGPAIGALDAFLRHAGHTLDGLTRQVTDAVRIAIERDKHSGGNIQLELLAEPEWGR